MILLIAVVSAVGMSIHGRVVDLTDDSISEHALSIFSLTDPNKRLGQDEDRVEWFNQVWDRTVSSPQTLLVGQGFGEPLIDFAPDGIPVRQPHNTTLGVFGRLGTLGVCIWVLFHFIILRRFVKTIKASRGTKSETRDVLIWLLTFYV
jgi:hypothetical protein